MSTFLNEILAAGWLCWSQVVVVIAKTADFPVTVGVLLKRKTKGIWVCELAAGDAIAIAITLSIILNRTIWHFAIICYRAITMVVVLSFLFKIFWRGLDGNRGIEVIVCLAVVLVRQICQEICSCCGCTCIRVGRCEKVDRGI